MFVCCGVCLFFCYYLLKGYAKEMQRRVDRLEEQLRQKDEEKKRLEQELEYLQKSKTLLAINSNKCLNDMRGYLLEYQKAMFKSDT